MRGKKKLLSNIMHAAGIDRINLLNRNILFVLAYHRIKPHHDYVCRFDEDVWGPEINQFRAHIRWLQKHTTLLKKDEVLALLESKLCGGGPYSAITFDDGYVDNYQYAFPVLKELGACATFFIPSEQIQERYVGWWDMIAYYVKNSAKRSITIHGKDFSLEGNKARLAAIRAIQRMMKLEPARETRGLVHELSQVCNVPEPPAEAQDLELMTWQQIGEMVEAGMSIGSHGHSHTVLSTMSLEHQIEEMKQSRKILAEKTGQLIDSIAFPVGGKDHFSDQTCRAAKALGYKLLYSFNTGFNILGDTKDGHIKRFAPGNDLPSLTSALANPKIFL